MRSINETQTSTLRESTPKPGCCRYSVECPTTKNSLFLLVVAAWTRVNIPSDSNSSHRHLLIPSFFLFLFSLSSFLHRRLCFRFNLSLLRSGITKSSTELEIVGDLRLAGPPIPPSSPITLGGKMGVNGGETGYRMPWIVYLQSVSVIRTEYSVHMENCHSVSFRHIQVLRIRVYAPHRRLALCRYTAQSILQALSTHFTLERGHECGASR